MSCHHTDLEYDDDDDEVDDDDDDDNERTMAESNLGGSKNGARARDGWPANLPLLSKISGNR